MKKYRLLSILCMAMAVVCLLLLADPTEAQAATEVASGTCGADGDNLTWSLDDEGTLTISGTGAMKKWYATTMAPWYSQRSKITSVTINDGVTSIGSYAFYNCTKIASIEIPDSVIAIGGEAFYSCKGLTSVSIPNNVTSIESYTFYNCTNLKTVIMPDNLNSIGAYAFRYCSKLSLIGIPEGVTSIGKSAFQNCNGVAEIQFNAVDMNDLCSENLAFQNSGSSTGGIKITIGTQVTKIPAYLFYGYSYTTSIEFKEGGKCTSIGDYAFASCEKLTSLNMPDSIINVGESAFYNCKALTSVTIGSGTTNIGNDAFLKCSNLEYVYISDLKAWCMIDFANIAANPVYYAEKLHLNSKLLSGALKIPEGTERISLGAFYSCTDLTSVTIPASVTKINNFAFAGCTNVSTISLKEGLKTFGSSVFSDCTCLTSITIPDSVVEIGEYAFSYCSSLTEIVIPEDVVSIGQFAFKNCTGLISATIDGNAVNVGSSAFYNCTALSSVTFGDGVKSVDTDAFYDCSKLERVYIGNITVWCEIEFKNEKANPLVMGGKLYLNNKLLSGALSIPEGTKSIGYCAFYNCTGITSVVIPKSVTKISDYAFLDCSGITSVTLGNGVETIGVAAFENCAMLSEITFGSNVKSVARNAFYLCKSLQKVNITDLKAWCMIDFEQQNSNPTYFSNKLYLNNTLVSGNLIIPDEVTAIGSYSFTCCVDITSVIISDGVKTIGSGSFRDCTGINSVTIPNSMESIGEVAFDNCRGITSFTIPDSVMSIGQSAFFNCTGMTRIVFEGSAPTIGLYAFYNVTTTACYPGNDETWTEDVRQNYNGTITWVAYTRESVAVGDTVYDSFADALVACEAGQYIKLGSDVVADAAIEKDLYIDLNGFDLSGTVVTNGYKIYGMDSTTDSYSCEAIGYMNLVDENGNEIVPEAHFMSDITGSSKRYMAIKDENGYSFHRFFLGVTHMSVKPSSTGVGYKAVFYGDDMVAAALDSFGFTMQLDGNDPITVNMSGDKFVSGKVITLRIDNYDVEHFGETGLSAKVMLQLTDGTVIESGAATMTFRGLMEQLNTGSDALTADQLAAIAALIEKHAIIKQWDTENLHK